MNAIVITPPLVQLNAPYPSGAYLNSFFKSQNFDSTWYDLNISLFYSIFSQQGLSKLFQISENNALQIAKKAAQNGDENTAFNLRRYVSTQKQWIQWIDWITAMLCDGGTSQKSSREKQHQFLYSPFAPRGNRMLSYLENLPEQPTVDDVRLLCSLALADLSDYITIAFDSNFSLIRYAESLAVDERDFSQIKAQLDSPVMKEFYQPVLDFYFGCSGSEAAVAPSKVPPFGSIGRKSVAFTTTASQPLHGLTQENHQENKEKKSKILVCISIPFAGTLLPALYTARYFKQQYKDSVYVCIGGGFVNTELRNANQKDLAEFVDAISYDRGYGSYYQILQNFKDGKNIQNPIYKLRQFNKNPQGKIEVIEPLWQELKTEKIEDEFTKTNMPDYSDIDFSIYPRVSDDTNQMHRLWTDGAWIKAYLAHGCYWHKCAFCDTQLDYVCAYKPVAVDKLYKRLSETSEAKGVYGIHFVDEALPPAMLKEFAIKNLQEKGQLYYWGNVRFEKTFTKDLAALLSAGGFAAVSAGLEVATGSGLKNINKGTDIESIVSACAAFKEAGILVHAYMIYGFWNDTPQSIIDSMETLRQFFAAGLLDSAFWHKFMLTRNSQVYSDWQKGLHPDLKPIEPKTDGSIFAQNNLRFKGEEQYDKFGSPLENAVNAWMHGEHLNTKVQRWFDFSVPAPTVPKDFVEKCIIKYEKKNSRLFEKDGNPSEKEIEGLYWIGSEPIVFENKLYWMYLQEENLFICQDKKQAIEIRNLLINLSGESKEQTRSNVIGKLKNCKEHLKLLQNLHGKGLVRI